MADEKLNILILSIGDWSGAGYALSQAINNTTSNVSRLISYSTSGDYIFYPTDIHNPTIKELTEWCDWADVINVSDDATEHIPFGAKLKPIVETYHGSWYRNDPELHNKMASFRKRPQTCLTQDLSVHGPTWIGRPITDLSHMKAQSQEFIVFHSPTNRTIKGTNAIISELGGLSEIALQVFEKGTNVECLANKAKASLFIDDYGHGLGYGTNSLEAWSMGIPVISSATPETSNQIIKLVGYIPFCPAKEYGSLADTVKKFATDPELYKKWADIGKKYVTDFHSQEHVANKYMEIYHKARCDFNAYIDQRPHNRKISVCMIVKDEQNKMPLAINSAIGLADEIVVLDTGSSDNTVQIAQDLGCKVITDGDRMNKGAMRNKAIDECSGDYSVVLDADEIITDPFGLYEFLQNTTHAAATIVAGSSMGKGLNPTEHFNQLRCWVPGMVRYKYRAHELPDFVDHEKYDEVNSGILFAHYPVWGNWKWKAQYTLDRLILDVKENPESARPRYYLGRQYFYLDRYDDAIATLNEYLTMTNGKYLFDRCNAYWDLYECYTAKGCKHDAVRSLYLACFEQPVNRKWWIELASKYHEMGKYEIALGFALTALQIRQGTEVGYANASSFGPDIYDLTARILWKLDRPEEGLKYAAIAVSLDPNNKRLIDNLGYFVRKIAK